MSPSIELLKNKFAAMLQAIAGQIDTKLDSSSAAVSANRLTTPFTLTITGDADGNTSLDGSGPALINIVLDATGVAAGTYPKVTVDAKGRVTGGGLLLAADIPALDAGKVTTGVFAIARIPDLDASKITTGTLAAGRIPLLNQDTTGNAGSADKLSVQRTLTISGDVTGSVATDWFTNPTLSLTLSSSGATPGVYPKVTVDAKGRVTGGSALAATDIPSLDAAKIGSGVFAAARIPALGYLPTTGGTLTGPLTGTTVYTDNWFRSNGASGWYSETYGGGIHMSDATWVRVYGGKNFYCANDIAASGDISGYYSDERLKTNIRYMSGALDIIRNVRAIRYNANDLAASFGFDPSKEEIGFGAQNVKSHVPEVVELAPFDYGASSTESASGENYMTLKYHRLIPVAFEGIRELDEKVEVNRIDLDKLIMTVANLAAQVEELKSKV